ncbi:MAG: hypothetical protein U0165_13565 [Polyangiaceae bacterium]
MATKVSSKAIARWLEEAATMGEIEAPKLPMHVLLGEARDVARFAEKYAEPQIDSVTKKVRRPGLKDANFPGESRIPDEIADEIRALELAVDEADAEYRAAVASIEPKEDPRGRALLVLGEIRGALEWLLDVDGQGDARMTMLAREYASVPSSADELASALGAYGRVAIEERARLEYLPSFDVRMIDEVEGLADDIRERPQGIERDARSDEALAHRNALALVLNERVRQVRAAARWVFRAYPAIQREVTSAYARRAKTRSRRKQQEAHVLSPPAGPQPPHDYKRGACGSGW